MRGAPRQVPSHFSGPNHFLAPLQTSRYRLRTTRLDKKKINKGRVRRPRLPGSRELERTFLFRPSPSRPGVKSLTRLSDLPTPRPGAMAESAPSGAKAAERRDHPAPSPNSHRPKGQFQRQKHRYLLLPPPTPPIRKHPDHPLELGLLAREELVPEERLRLPPDAVRARADVARDDDLAQTLGALGDRAREGEE